jgi:outer membrane immunogenic protein
VMSRLANTWAQLALALIFGFAFTHKAAAQAQPPPPPLSADSPDNCGVGLGVAAAGLGIAAFTADKSRPPPRNWSGLYVGGHLGCAWADTDLTFLNTSGFGSTGDATSLDTSGWIGGGHIGYNHQMGRWVLGIEATLSGGDLQETKLNPFNPDPPVFSETLTIDIDWLFTATGRLGYTWAPRWLTYVKGGYASANIEASMLAVTAVGRSETSTSAVHHGWTVGAGMEYMLAPNIIIGAEYNYISLASKTHQMQACTPDPCIPIPSVNVDPDDIHSVTGRISFKFGGDGRPSPLK